MALESLAAETYQFMESVASSKGCKAGGPLSPGEMDWSIDEQVQLFQLVNAKQIGVSLNTVGMMSPLKSVSLVIGIGPEMPRWTHAEICARCFRNTTCRYSQMPR